MKRFTSSLLAAAAIAVMLSAGPANAGESGRHAAAGSNHSAQAASHGSAAVATGAAVVASVPVAIAGGAMSAAGAGLYSLGAASNQAGDTLLKTSIDLSSGPAARGGAKAEPMRPDSAPRLD